MKSTLAIGALCFLATAAVADPLPKKCAAESPDDTPCSKIAGKYKIELAPREKSCVVKKKTSAIVTIKSEGNRPKFDAAPLLRALGLRPLKTDPPELSSAIRDGVCCIDLRLYGQQGKNNQRVLIHMAAGATKVGADGKDRWIDDKDDMCGDEELDVTVTRVK